MTPSLRAAALLLVLCLGAGAPRAQEPPPSLGPSRETDFLPPPAVCDVDACAARWPSFRAFDCSYQPSVGPRRYCVETSASAAPAPEPEPAPAAASAPDRAPAAASGEDPVSRGAERPQPTLGPDRAPRAGDALGPEFEPPRQRAEPASAPKPERPQSVALRLRAILVSPVTWFVSAATVIGFLVAAIRTKRLAARKLALVEGGALAVVAKADFGRQRITGGRGLVGALRRRLVLDLAPLEEAPKATRGPSR